MQHDDAPPRVSRRVSLLAGSCMLALMGSLQMAEAAAPVQADANCPVPPAVTQVSAASIYANKSGSVVDQAGLHLNQQLIEPLRLFDRSLTAKVDGAATQPDLACAETLLKTWAAAGALLQEPTAFPSMRERQRFTIGINVGALKLQSHGGVIDDTVIAWLHQLNAAVMADFTKRNIVDNLYVWSAVDAASFALLSGDQAASLYQDRVWQAGLAQIGVDGSLKSELRRQTRALLYHQYYLSGLLYLRKIRAALGRPATAGEDTTLRRLASFVESSLCDPTAIAKASGGFKQETAPPDQFAIGLAFGQGIIDDRWSRCGVAPPAQNDETLGGSLRMTLAVLEGEAASAHATRSP